mgnify:CR=1 FL=1
MLVYAESSAVLAWLLGEKEGALVLACLREAKDVLSSELTVTECQRALVRLETARLLSPGDARSRRSILLRAARSWSMVALTPELHERAGRPFPREPVRTLDALHLAMATCIAELHPGIRVLTLDPRIRENAEALGLTVLV